MIFFLNSLSRNKKIFITVAFDCFVAIFSVYIAYIIRLENFTYFNLGTIPAYFLSLLFLPIFYFFSIYRSILRYAGLTTLKKIFNASIIYSFIYFTFCFFLFIPEIPRSIGIIQPLIFFLFIVVGRVFISGIIQNGDTYSRKNILIYGAGKAGVQILNSTFYGSKYNVIAFIDDNIKKNKTKINEITVYHASHIPKLLESNKISEVFIAISNLSVEKKRDLLDLIPNAEISIKFLPDFFNSSQATVDLNQFKELEITDLISREMFQLIPDFKLNRDEVFLVTGAGGSIGSELSKQIINLNPSKIILVENTEINLFMVDNLLSIIANKKQINVEIIPLLSSVCNSNNMEEIFKVHCPTYVFHAAAYKHVTLVEKNIPQAIYNNIYGTSVLCHLSNKYKVKYFTLISTDKAVNPKSIMGSTKKVSEMIVQNYIDNDHHNEINFSIVRFGNVFGSSGSVIQLFKNQIESRSSITITDKDATRYFMSISEAVTLIIQSTQIKEKKKIFVLEMGEPINILDLAKKMIRLSGLSIKDAENVNGDIEIKFIGLKSGEKLHEELFEKDSLKNTNIDKIKYTSEYHPLTPKVDEILNKLLALKSEVDIRRFLIEKKLLNSN